MHHPRLVAFEGRLKELFDAVDDQLERRYGTLYPLHPSRAAEGTTASPEQDGLFNIGAAFSAGYGSRIGRSYVVEVRMVTLAEVPDAVREEITETAVQLVRDRLPDYFPKRELQVSRENSVFKIHGDLSLGQA
ncbi:MAG TPA: hypothetical protein VMW87_12165 [Spirochaetia bacterium]|nr:hypothetical protein [Spirochaetia bacterium]